MERAERIKKVPPYLFALIDKKKREAIAKGVDIISFGIGDPDQPTPTQVVDLAARGLPLPVLDAIYESRERAVQNQCAQRLVDLDRQCSEAVQRERRRAIVCPDPYWPGRPGRGGVYWGW